MENSELERFNSGIIDDLPDEVHKEDAPQPDPDDIVLNENQGAQNAEAAEDAGDALSEVESKSAEPEAGEDPAPEEDKLHALPSQYQRDVLIQRITLKKRYRRILTATVTVMLLIAAAAVFIAMILCPVIRISGGGMEPTYHSGDIIVLFNTKNYEAGELVCISYKNKLLVKRVIATAGETVSIDENGNVSVGGAVLDEPYAINKSLGECDIEFPYVVPKGSYFVMGDRRDTSVDSRSTLVGSIGEDDIVGKVLLKVWPINSNQ